MRILLMGFFFTIGCGPTTHELTPEQRRAVEIHPNPKPTLPAGQCNSQVFCNQPQWCKYPDDPPTRWMITGVCTDPVY